MPKKGVEKSHSETALFAALYRAAANKEFKNKGLGPDYLAEYFLPSHLRFFLKFKKIRSLIKSKSNKLTPGIYEYMLARTAFFDNAFTDALNQNIQQIVLLGAGYDTRAYRFAKLNKATKIIELDIATTQIRKNKCLKKGGIDIPELVTLVPIDFNREALKIVLGNAGYKDNERTLFIWEGVSYYLAPEAVDATLEFVTGSTHKKSVLAFDYAISISPGNIQNYYGAEEFFQVWRKHHSDEPFRFAIDEGKIGLFLKQRGLEIASHLNNREIEETFLKRRNGSIIGSVTGLFRFALASPLNDPQY